MRYSHLARIKNGTIRLAHRVALCAMLVGGVKSYAAGTDTWVGNTDANWSTAANWTTVGGSTPPANGDWLVFGATGSSGVALNDNRSGLTLHKLTFNSGAVDRY